MAKQKIAKKALLDLLQKQMKGIRLDAPCDGCVPHNLVRSHRGSPDPNWRPDMNRVVGSPDCERRLHKVLDDFLDRYDVIFPPGE